ncbi:unnamed protein product [Triticum aestivum]|uniref:FLZ-type domain-containing protein n=2 Tax=Triticum aestivum TaxID=4565 RepID=A0A9R1EYE1_WHEAT|nr:ATP-dependent RNA helicase glh-2 [Aegilops tauschii subsp. strangulata]XP_044334261.1 ATP-dependent RNA helicase glh-2-like [Triticum aestivum]KAF7018362.1 hypothetical protein CFC21_031661 [Triticum aestivum]SPT19921.1 unnamed protein product [Triticum aestivum]
MDSSSSSASAHGSGAGAGLLGRGGGKGGSSGAGNGSGSGSGIGGDSTSTIGGGGASADAWTRLVSSGVEDDLVCAVGAGAGFGAGGLPYGYFLDACFLCRKPIASNRDIFMYRGDIAFCSEECRTEQMEADEEMERKEKSASAKKLSQRPPSLGEVESPPRPPKTRAGSILAG